MKRLNIPALLIGLIAALLIVTVGVAQPKGRKVTIKGEAVDLWCYLEGGDRGPAKKNAPPPVRKQEIPSASWTRKATFTWPRDFRDHQPAKDLLSDKMSEKVTVSGILVRKGGVPMIYIESMKQGSNLSPTTSGRTCGDTTDRVSADGGHV